jgi:hypothetical protein
MFSCILHCSLLAVIPMLSPPLRLVPYFHENIELIDPDRSEARVVLPSLGDLGALAGSSSSAGAEGVSRQPGAAAALHPPVAKFAGPQQILSDPTDATNDRQTIRRPDIVTPLKIKNPLPLPSMVQIPAPQLKLPTAMPAFLAQPVPAMPQRAEITSNAPPPVKEPVLVVRQSQTPPKLADVPPPNVVPDAKQMAPQLSPASGNAPLLAKAVVVVNAVEPGPVANAAIPDAEVSGRFSVAPMNVTVAAPSSGSANGIADASGRKGGAPGVGTPTGSGGASAGHGGTGASSYGNGSGAGVAGNGAGTRAGAGNGAGSGAGSGSAPGAGAGAGSGNGNPGLGNGGVGNGSGRLGGISIAGGSGARGGGAGGSMASVSHSYHLTIIAAGSNGGATRDLGVFATGETVYTVSLSMRDAGGGPDWPMQYSLGRLSNAKGALVPPYAAKQVSAIASDTGRDPSAVFIAGEIDTEGKLQSLRAARPSDTRSAAAIAVLQQWQFIPAKLDGKPVQAKVLIGVQFAQRDTANSSK